MSTKMDVRKYIKIRGANENNLKNIDVDIPRNELVVLTGLSGSGKSLCRRAEKIYGIIIFLCKTVFGANGETGCGKHRGTVACNFH